MKASEFEIILQTRIENIDYILCKKAKEYAQNEDRLYNFKRASVILNTSPEKALWGMALKHLVSVMDLVEGKLELNKYNVDEKIGDLINYLILLEALFKEKIESKKT